MIVPPITGVIAGCNILNNMNYEDEQEPPNRRKRKKIITPADFYSVKMSDGKIYCGNTKRELELNIKEGRYFNIDKKQQSKHQKKKLPWPFG